MRRFVLAAACLGLAVASAGDIEAQSSQQLRARGYIGVGGGLAVPVGDLSDAAKTGWMGQLVGGYTSRGGLLGARIDATYGQNSLKTTGNVKLVGATGNVVVTPGHRPANIHPYFLAGAGLYRVSSTGGTAVTKVALNGGGGVQFHMGHRSDLFVEARFLTIRTDGPTNLIPIIVGFRWGGI